MEKHRTQQEHTLKVHKKGRWMAARTNFGINRAALAINWLPDAWKGVINSQVTLKNSSF